MVVVLTLGGGAVVGGGGGGGEGSVTALRRKRERVSVVDGGRAEEELPHEEQRDGGEQDPQRRQPLPFDAHDRARAAAGPSAPSSGLARPSAPLETLRRQPLDAAAAAVEMGGGESGRLFGERAAAAAADVGERPPRLRAESGVVRARA